MKAMFAAAGGRWRRQAIAAATSALVAVAVVAFAASCDTTGLMFRNDHRIGIDSPAADATVTLPITVRFTVRNAPVNAATYGVFLDRTPPRPGNAVPADADLAGIYLTTRTQVTIDNVVRPTSGPSGARDNHVVTVVFFDSAGCRVGESAASVQFKVKT